MSTISQIRTALQTRLATISGLDVYDTVPGTINPPAAIVQRRSGPHPDTLGASRVSYTMQVTVLLGLADDQAAQNALDGYLSPTGADSILAAVDADETLGGKVDYALVVDVEQDAIMEFAGMKMLGAHVVVEVGA